MASHEAEILGILNRFPRNSNYVIVMGAGVSKSAGFPTFRNGGDGAYQKFGEESFHIRALETPQSRRKQLDMIDEMLQIRRSSKPTKFHELMRQLAKEGDLVRCYTQNVDGLEDIPKKFNATWPIVISLHGRLDIVFCDKCFHEQPYDRSLFDSESSMASCSNCPPGRTRSGNNPGTLRTRMLLYDDPIDRDHEFIQKVLASDLQLGINVLLVVGTSLSEEVVGTRNIVKTLCGGQNTKAVWINPLPPPTDLTKYFNIVILKTSDEFAMIFDKYRRAIEPGIIKIEKHEGDLFHVQWATDTGQWPSTWERCCKIKEWGGYGHLLAYMLQQRGLDTACERCRPPSQYTTDDNQTIQMHI